MRVIRLSNVERLAVTGTVQRFQDSLDEAVAVRNKELQVVLAEHAVHRIPKSFAVRTDSEGYVLSIEWEDGCVAEPSDESKDEPPC